MNKQRRKILMEVIESLEEAQASIEEIKDEESEAYDNMPESLQYSEKGELMYQNVDELETASSDLETVIDTLSGIANT